MNDEFEFFDLWTRIKLCLFLKLGNSLWQYKIIHTDYWKHFYGISFTERRDFPKLLKYDIVDIDDDLEVEMKKNC